MALKISAHFPIFPPSITTSRRRSPTEIRFSRWNNANAEPFLRREREQKDIEDDIRRQRRYQSATRIAEDSDDGSADPPPSSVDFKSHGTPSAPSSPSIPGKVSKYSKPSQKPRNPRSSSHPAFRRISRASGAARVLPENDVDNGIWVGERGITYKIKDAPFEFQYSYTETPKVKPLALREPPFLPFGPTTMPRPWTGRAPLPASKKKLPEFDSFRLPPAGKKGVKPVQSPGPYLRGSGPKYTAATREEILGEPLTGEEIKELIKGCLRTQRQLNMGRDGLTHNMLDNIHAHWKRRRVCKIKCKGVCTIDIDNVRQQLEEKTGGKIIYCKGGVMFLFRGRNYNYRTRPRYPLMLWKPITPVYPRLVQRVPEGLTLEEATAMRKKGRQLPPICKLGKNGVYSDLCKNVKEAFEACELVRINCTGMNKSDCRKIGAKLKDLVPCVLISFEYEHILMWRGKDWKSSLPPPEDIHNGAVELIADGAAATTSSQSTPDSPELHAGRRPNGLISALPTANMSMIGDVGMGEAAASCNLETMDQPSVVPSVNPTLMADSAVYSSTVIHQEPPASDAGKSSDEDQYSEMPCQSISLNQSSSLEGHNDFSHPSSTMEPPRIDGIGSTDELEMIPADGTTRSCGECLDGVMLLLQQAMESGSAVVLDDESLDANIVFERSVALAKTAPPGPIFQQRIRKTVIQKAKREKSRNLDDEQVVVVEDITVSGNRSNEKNSRSRKRENILEVAQHMVPHGSLRVDELAKLLA